MQLCEGLAACAINSYGTAALASTLTQVSAEVYDWPYGTAVPASTLTQVRAEVYADS